MWVQSGPLPQPDPLGVVHDRPRPGRTLDRFRQRETNGVRLSTDSPEPHQTAQIPLRGRIQMQVQLRHVQILYIMPTKRQDTICIPDHGIRVRADIVSEPYRGVHVQVDELTLVGLSAFIPCVP